MNEIVISSFQDYIKNGLEDIITDFSNDGVCSNCGGCCSRLLPVSKKECEIIKRYVKDYNIKAEQNFAPLAKALVDMTCPFRNNKEHKCNIYEVRPKICRYFTCHDVSAAKFNREKYGKSMNIIDMRKEFFKQDFYFSKRSD